MCRLILLTVIKMTYKVVIKFKNGKFIGHKISKN